MNNEVSKKLAPLQESFDNVAHDVRQLHQYSQESRVLMDNWNQYFLQNVTVLQSKALKEDAVTALSQAVELQQKSIDLIRDDMDRLRQALKQIVTTYNGYLMNTANRVTDLQKSINVVRLERRTPPVIPKNFTRKTISKVLSSAEQAILFIFASKDKYLSYADVCVLYGRSASNVAGILNRLKRKNIPFDKKRGAKGVVQHRLNQEFRTRLLAKV